MSADVLRSWTRVRYEKLARQAALRRLRGRETLQVASLRREVSPMSQRHALIIASYFPLPVTSGGRKRSVRLLEAMERAGLHPIVLSAAPYTVSEEQVTFARARGWSVELYEQPHLGWRRPLKHVRRLPVLPSRELGARLRGLSPGSVAVVQAEDQFAAKYLPHVPTRTAPTVLSTHNVDSELLDQRAAAAGRTLGRIRLRYRAAKRRSLDRYLAKRSTAILCVSEYDRAYYHAAGAGSRALLVPNGVDDELFTVPPLGTLEHVLFFGYLGYRPNAEGLKRFLEAWPLVADARPAARLRIAGAFPDSGLRNRAATMERVDVLGFVEDLLAELAASRVVIAPLWQGAGTRMKVLEAMAAARPVVGTPLGVERIGFRPGEHGEQGESAHDLAVAVIKLLGAPERCVEQGAAARVHAERFRWARVLKPAEDLYRAYAERQPCE